MGAPSDQRVGVAVSRAVRNAAVAMMAGAKNLPQASREAAKEYSPPRKRWVPSQKKRKPRKGRRNDTDSREEPRMSPKVLAVAVLLFVVGFIVLDQSPVRAGETSPAPG